MVLAAAMAGLIVPAIFWSQFLNRLRFLTLVYVCLWTAFAASQAPDPVASTDQALNQPAQARYRLPGNPPLFFPS